MCTTADPPGHSGPALLLGLEQIVTGFDEAERTVDALAERLG
jgi:hypothetical protein